MTSHPLLSDSESLRCRAGVETILQYTFASGRLLIEALTAPGAEEKDHQGNRWLAELGLDVIRYCLTMDGYKKKVKPSILASQKQKLCSYGHLKTVAERTALDKCIIYNPRSGMGRPVVVGRALAAVVAAAHLDSKRDNEMVWRILNHIGFTAHDDSGINPALLEIRPHTHPSAFPIDRGDDEGASHTSSTRTCSSGCQPEMIGNLLQHPDANAAESRNMAREQVPTTSVRRKRDHPSPLDAQGVCKRPTPNPRHEQVSLYLERERNRCRSWGFSLPEDSYFSEKIQAELTQLSDPRKFSLCQRFLLCISSPQSVVLLRDAIQSWRSGTRAQPAERLGSLSPCEVFGLIERNSQDIAHLVILQRYYILTLFQKCGGDCTPLTTGFVPMTGSQGVLARGRGNPLHSIEADVSARMLHVVFPHLEKGSSDYKRKVDVMKTLRIRGRRYQALTRYFGEGILALLPWSGQLGQADIGLSENELSRLPDNLFSKLLDILKETQGRTLKSFSQEAWSIVSQMISCPVDQCPRFPLENVRSSEILEHPKNSPGLLRMLIGPDSLPLSGLPCAATQY